MFARDSGLTFDEIADYLDKTNNDGTATSVKSD
jgi:hypothetical protein